MFSGNALLRAGLFSLLVTFGSYAHAGQTVPASRLTQTAKTTKTIKAMAHAKAQADPPKRTERNKKMDTFIVYIGTYTNTTSEGIYIYQMDGATGMLTPAGHGPKITDPSFLAIAPNHKYLYAVDEISDFNGSKGGAVSALAIDPKTGGLTLLNQQPSAGSGPCFITTDAKGKNVLVANYGSGSVAVLPVGADGKLQASHSFVQHTGMGTDPARQEGPHAHSINLDAANHFAFAADLGLDKIFIYRYDAAKGAITPNTPAFATLAPGSGPRHFVFHPGGKFAYVINEMKSTVTAFAYDAAKGELTELQTISSLPEGFSGENSTAEIRVHPSGKFLYGSNRGHNSIVIYAIDGTTGNLKLVGHESTQGKTPRNFNLDPTGHFLLAANQDTDNVVVFRIDMQTGQLTPTGQSLDIPRPVCIRFMPLTR